MTLTSQEKQQLRAHAHKLKPVVMTGNQGLTPAVLNEIEVALTAHELIKVKLNAEREDRQKMIEEISQATKSEIVQTIGRIAVFFRLRD